MNTWSKLRLSYLERKYACPPTLYVECTNRCNAKCIFCLYPALESSLQTEILSLEKYEEIIRQYREMGGRRIALTPTLADPLTDPKFASRLDIASRNGITDVSFFTNLISFGPSVQEALSTSNLHLKLHVSFTGFDQEHYKQFMGVDRFERVKKHLGILGKIASQNPLLDARVVMRDYSESEPQKSALIAFIKDCGLKFIIETEFDSWGGEVENEIIASDRLRLKERDPRSGPCKISLLKPLVTVEGQLKLCDCRDAYGDLEVGNVFEEGLRKLWLGSRTKKLRRLFYRPDALPVICQKCEYYHSI